MFVILCHQTDTASVLSEAIEYIKFLHEQVSVSAHLMSFFVLNFEKHYNYLKIKNKKNPGIEHSIFEERCCSTAAAAAEMV